MAEKESRRKCFKCGCSPAEDKIKLFRFPKPAVRNLIRCELWAKYIFPERDYSSTELQMKLYSEHRMLCQKHFIEDDFTDDSKSALLRTAAPCDMEEAYTRKRKKRHSSITSESNKSDHVGENDTRLENENSAQSGELSEKSVVPGMQTYSWQRRSQAIVDKPEIEDLDNVSLYCGEEECEDTTQKKKSLVHEGFFCDACRGEIEGFRYTCVQCEDFDLCRSCELNGAHAHHYMLRVPAPKPYPEIQFVIATIRQQLTQQLDSNKENAQDEDDAVSIKSEVKSLVDEDEEMEIERLDEDLIDGLDTSRLSNKDEAEDDVTDTSMNEGEEQKQQISVVASPHHSTNTGTSKTILSTAKEKIPIKVKDFGKIEQCSKQATKIKMEPVSDKESRDRILKLCMPNIQLKQGSKFKLFKLPPGTVLKPGDKVPFQLLPKSKG